jgi:hypothetical protein
VKISVISHWQNEEFLAPFYLGHYAFADEIIIMLDKSTTDRSAEIIGRYSNAKFEWVDHGGKINDRLLSDMLNDLAAGLKSDWVINADSDELAFPYGMGDPRSALERAGGNLIEVWFRWVYRHRTDTDLDPSRPAILQRRHGGKYTIWPNCGDKFMKPCIIKPEAGIRWGIGRHSFEPNPRVKISATKFDGVHWQMADPEMAVRRSIERTSGAGRLSEENVKHGWGVRNWTPELIRAECERHLDDPLVF